jgi:hypothetical protein
MQSRLPGADIDRKNLRNIFEASLTRFFECEIDEVMNNVNERSSCTRLAVYLQGMADQAGLNNYFVDTEYNRMQKGKIKTCLDDNMVVVRINCDLILHGRGKCGSNENLIAIEMKKVGRPLSHYAKDRQRLRALTKDPNREINQVWAVGDVDLEWPEHVCGYILGVFILLDRSERTCTVEYFEKGESFRSYQRKF